jgi:hypothetical protein
VFSFRGPLAAVVAALCLVIPASAFAQSAGDDQYADPFNEQPAGNQPVGQPDDSNSGGGGGNSSPTQVADTTSTSTSTSSANRLAYTGFDLPLLFVTGAVMALAGFTVRRVVAGPYSAPR